MVDDASFSKVGGLAAVAAGYPLRGAVDALSQGDVRLVQLKNTTADGGIDWADVPNVSLPSTREPAWLRDGDVIFSSRGTKTLAYALSNVPPKAVCAPQFFVLTLRSPTILPEFLAWQMNQKPAQDYFQREATGSYIQNIRRSVLEELPIVVPPLHVQELIVGFWRTAQQERAALGRLIQNRNNQLEALANGLLHAYPGDGA